VVERKPSLGSQGLSSIGTAHPFVHIKSADNGKWTVLCQARQDTNKDGKVEVRIGWHGATGGDALVPYLVTPGRSGGEAIDDYVAWSSGGRHLLFIQDKQLFILDASTGKRTLLPNAITSDQHSPFTNGSGSFGDNGARIVYRRPCGAKTCAVVRTLATGDEREVDPGDGRFLRTRLDGDAPWLYLFVQPGEEGPPPGRFTTLAARRCRGPVRSMTMGPSYEPTLEIRALPLKGRSWRQPRAVKGIRGALGNALLVKQEGALRLLTAEGETTEIAPASCGPDLVGANPGLGRMLVACSKKGKDDLEPAYIADQQGLRPANRWLRKERCESYSKPLFASRRFFKVCQVIPDEESEAPPGYLNMMVQDDSLFFDWESESWFEGRFAAQHGSSVVMRGAGGKLELWTPTSGARKRLKQTVDEIGLQRAGPYMLAGFDLIHLDRWRHMGRVHGSVWLNGQARPGFVPRVHALTSSGRILFSKTPSPPRSAPAPRRNRLHSGPLYWSDAVRVMGQP